MSKKVLGAAVAAATTVAVVGTAAFAAVPAPITGPSSSQSPYLIAERDGLGITSLITTGDAVNGYKAAGIMDGLGAYDNGDGTFTVLINHEINATLGVTRAHGAIGAFVSKWTIDKATLQVKAGEDLIKKVMVDPEADGTFVPATGDALALNRLCSADLPELTAFYNAATGKGTTNRIFMNGEESGSEGRAFAHVVTGPDAGTSYALPWLGRASWENVVALPDQGDKTVVVLTDDSGGGQVYVYVGTKTDTGSDIAKAGLVGGKLYGVSIAGVADETDATTVPANGVPFTLVEIPNAATMKTGADLETASNAANISRMARPEDSAWDPTRLDRLYFATTASFKGTSRLWSLDFADSINPETGGVARIVVQSPAYNNALPSDKQAGPRMLDNLTVTSKGNVLLQEDPGNDEYLSGIYEYDAQTGGVSRIVKHDPARFSTGGASFQTKNEESSGIIEVPFVGANKFLTVVQSHLTSNDPALVEGGQLALLDLRRGVNMTATATDFAADAAGVVKVAVSPASATGSVQLFSGTKLIGTGAISGGVASIAVPAKSLAAGSQPMTVKYLGDDSFAPAQASLPLQVNPANPTTSPSASAKPSTSPAPTATATATATATTTAQPAAKVASTVTATVAPGSLQVLKDRASVEVAVKSAKGTPTGVVSVLVDDVAVSAAALSVTGTATITLPPFQSLGDKKITVKYFGDDATAGSVSTATTVTVVKSTPTINISKMKPVKARKGKASVMVSVQGPTPATGTVTFTSKGFKKPVVAKVTNGVAVASLKSFVKRGNFAVLATYSGNDLLASVSATGGVKVKR